MDRVEERRTQSQTTVMMTISSGNVGISTSAPVVFSPPTSSRLVISKGSYKPGPSSPLHVVGVGATGLGTTEPHYQANLETEEERYERLLEEKFVTSW